MIIKKYTLVFVFILTGFAIVKAQTPAGQDANYIKTITARADKIVAGLGITDSVKYKRVQNIIINQYSSLSAIHDTRNAQVKDIKAQAGDDKTAANAKTKAIDDDVDTKLTKLHSEYLSKLGTELSADQVEKVKDAMTYNKVAVTYKGYLAEIPTLTEPQKVQIKAWLIEAREIAIDAESAEKKTAVFGKYKGRINNYLSTQGYDLKKEQEEWQKRIKEGSTGN
jgi:hypothetical protein